MTEVQCNICLDVLPLSEAKQAVISFELLWIHVWLCSTCHVSFIAKGGNRFVCLINYFTRN